MLVECLGLTPDRCFDVTRVWGGLAVDDCGDVGPFAVNGLQPRLLPEDEAAGLAPAVRAPVATGIEMDGTINPTSSNWKDCVTGFVRALVDPEPLAAKREHLGHERHAVKPAVAVERIQNLFFGPDFHPIAYAQLGRSWLHIRNRDRNLSPFSLLTRNWLRQEGTGSTRPSRDHDAVLTESHIFLHAPKGSCKARAEDIIQSR